MAIQRNHILGAIEIGLVGAYGTIALWLARPLWEDFRGLPETFVVHPLASLAAVFGCLTLLSIPLRVLEPPVYIVSLVHCAFALLATPLWLRAWLMVGGEPPIAPALIPVNLMLPVAVAYLLSSTEPRGERLARLFRMRSRLTWFDRVLVAFGLVFAFLLVYIGGRFGQLLFAIYVVAPLVVVMLIGRIVLSVVRRKKTPDLPLAGRHIRLKSTRVGPSQRRHYWTIIEEPRSDD